jgi:hypothetical protein
MVAQQAFWLDDSFDREHAPDGQSRYRAEVRRRVYEFADAWGDIAPVRFAVTAWRIATTLSPGYVRWHRRILGAICTRSPWDGSLIGEVNLVSPWPAELTWTKEWQHDRGWRDWPQVFGQYVTASDEDLTRNPHLRAWLVAQVPVPLNDLPAAPAGPDDDVDMAAQRAVTVLARELNAILGPLLDQLEAEIPQS